MNWEVRTMRSVTSCFNPTLFRKNMTRFWPIWAANLLIWLFVLPVDLLLNYDAWPDVQQFAHYRVLNSVMEIGLYMAVGFSLLAAVAVWSYLFNNRSACQMHTLPIRRKGLFWTNFLSGLNILVGPNLVAAGLTLLAELAVGYVKVWPVVVWFISVSLMELFFFCFATFCAMCTGHILGLPAFYGIFNILALGLSLLTEMVLSRFVFGYTGNLSSSGLVKFLTPIWLLESHVEVRMDRLDGQRLYETAWLSGVGFILVYVLVGLILLGAAYALYHYRHMERAGDVITVGWMRPVFQYGVAFCCALAFGNILYELFDDTLPETAWTLLLFLLICGAVGYFVARMLLEKSFRVLGSWKGCLPLLGALVVLVCAMELDLTGYERRVPAADRVEYVYFGGFNTEPYDEASHASAESEDPEVIAAAVALHRAITENKTAIENYKERSAQMVETDKPFYESTQRLTSFNISYKLTNGDTLVRGYWLPLYDVDLSDPDTVSAKLDTLINLPQVVEDQYRLEELSAATVVEMSLSAPCIVEEEGYISLEEVLIDPEAYETVLNAVRADMAEGNIGRRYLMGNEERMENCFINDLTITYYRSTEAVPYTATATTEESEPTKYTGDIIVTIQTTSRHTIAALRELGVLSRPVDLMTNARWEQLFADREWVDTGWTEADWAPYVEERLGE